MATIRDLLATAQSQRHSAVGQEALFNLLAALVGNLPENVQTDPKADNWSDAQGYEPGTYVKHDGKTYVSQRYGDNRRPDANGEYWKVYEPVSAQDSRPRVEGATTETVDAGTTHSKNKFR